MLRRSADAGSITADAAHAAHDDLLRMRVSLMPYEPFGSRIWALRGNLTAHDAWYVAVAEELGATLATLEGRLVRATGPTCAFEVPPSTG